MPSINIAIIASEITGMLVVSVFGIYLMRNYSKIPKSSKYFLYSIFALVIGLLSDSLSYYLEYSGSTNIALLFIVNLLAIISADFINMIFINYIYSVPDVKESNLKKQFLYIISFVCAVDIIFNIIGAFTGLTFYFENYIFRYGKLYFIYEINQLIVLLLGIIFTFVYRNKLKISSWHSVIGYYVIPFIVFVFNWFKPEAGFSYASLAISFTVVFIEIETKKEQFLSNRSYRDVLTRSYNRNAYEDLIERLKEQDDSKIIGIFFCDLNGLKYTNDTFGHAAGDKLIVKLATVLKSCFRDKDIFRVGGDEFVVIMVDIKEELFEMKKEKLIDCVKKEDDFVSIGSCFGYSKDINKLINQAESEMYDLKVKYHKARDEYQPK